ncbi:hypothetical protein [Luteimonas sp. A478]
MNSRRIFAGIVVMLAAAWALSFARELLNLEHLLADPVSGGLTLFISALLGGFVARSGFWVPALLLWLVIWASTIYFLHRIGAPTSAAPSVTDILSFNAVALATSLIGVSAGTLLGQHLSRRLTTAQSAAT